MKKVKWIVSICVVAAFVLVGVGAFRILEAVGPRSVHFLTTASTNLAGERVDDLKLHQSIKDPSFVSQYGTQLKPLNNALYDYYQVTSDLEVATNKGDDHIIRIIAYSFGQTHSGIKVGDSIDKVKAIYGTHDYERSEQGFTILGYVDKQSQESIEFWCGGNTVETIRLDVTSME